MRCSALILAIGAFWSSQASAGGPQSVYVAPGGIYIASGQIYVGPGSDGPPMLVPGPTYYQPNYAPPGPAYAPGYAPPGPVLYGVPTSYGQFAYPTPSTYVDQESTDVSPYEDLPPRPPLPVPYN
jgi:hypothetical protein